MIRKGSTVSWKWGNGKAEGTVIKTYEETITKTLKGTEVTKNGTSDNKALLIEQDDGDKVLKLTSEVNHQK